MWPPLRRAGRRARGDADGAALLARLDVSRFRPEGAGAGLHPPEMVAEPVLDVEDGRIQFRE